MSGDLSVCMVITSKFSVNFFVNKTKSTSTIAVVVIALFTTQVVLMCQYISLTSLQSQVNLYLTKNTTTKKQVIVKFHLQLSWSDTCIYHLPQNVHLSLSYSLVFCIF